MTPEPIPDSSSEPTSGPSSVPTSGPGPERAGTAAVGRADIARSAFIRRTAAFLLPAAVAVTIACGLGYAIVQQDLRQGANDPQVQLAEDAARRLDAGASPGSLVGPTEVDVARSLAPFVVIFDASGAVLATDGQLDGGAPVPPRGVLDTARSRGRDAVTWQPRDGVRVATVTVPWRGGAVMAGRSLRVVEEREAATELIAGAAWIAGLIGVAMAALLAAWLWPRDGDAIRR